MPGALHHLLSVLEAPPGMADAMLLKPNWSIGLGTLDWGSHSSLWVPWGRGSLRELCSPVHYLSWWFSVYDMIFMKFSCHFFFFFFFFFCLPFYNDC